MRNESLFAIIDALENSDEQSFFNHLLTLDSMGVFLGEDETKEAFIKRMNDLKESLNMLDKKVQQPEGYVIDSTLCLSYENQVQDDVVLASQQDLNSRYDVTLSWVPCFYPHVDLGLLWAGCTIEFEELPYPIILLKKAFATSERYLKIYTRSELISHELAHAARSPLKSTVYEEHFAYALSKSMLRRALGNCFQSQLDALIFIIPMLLVCAIQMTLFILKQPLDIAIYGGAIALLGPLYLLIRNARERAHVKRAFKHIEKQFSISHNIAQKILFRCTDQEINFFSKGIDFDDSLFLKNWRWKVIARKWLKVGEK